jgi:hypothetical protein
MPPIDRLRAATARRRVAELVLEQARQEYDRARREEDLARYERWRVVEGNIDGPWFITPHALERFVALVGTTGERERDIARVACDAKRAHRVKGTRDGCEIWRGPKPLRLRFIVGPGEGDKPALVTVLPAFDRSET